MTLLDAIAQRTSVRSYQPITLDRSLVQDIRAFLATLIPPFGAKARVELVHTSVFDGRVRLGTYGVIRGAGDFLVLAYRKGPLAEEAAAYILEQAVLYCTQLGLGTCWMGATFRMGDFARAARLHPGEKLLIVSPVGYKAPRRTLLDVTFGAMTKHTSREAFGDRFFHAAWGTPLDEQTAGEYAGPLEMVRLAPSARNKQPWRVVMDEAGVHFYREKEASRFTHADMGIAMCHFELACRELGLPGRWEQFFATPSSPEGFPYLISWVR